jgi:hypothetical protein
MPQMEPQPDLEHSSKEGIAQVENSDSLNRLDTINVDNYHGITVKTVLVYFV